MDRRQIISDRIHEFFQRGSVPEAQAHTFRKFLAFYDMKNGNLDEALVHVCNSLGTQLRNDVKFYLSSGENENPLNAPVVDPLDLKELTNYDDLVDKLGKMPSEWTVLQISRELNGTDVVGMTKEHRNADPTLIICRLPCGNMIKTVSPYLVKIEPPDNPVCGPNIMERLIELLQTRREYYNNRRDKTKEKIYQNSEAGLGSCLKEMECYWLREWKILLNGRLTDISLENEIRAKIQKWFTEHDKKRLDILYHLVQSAHLLKPKELMKVLKFALDTETDLDNLAIMMDQIKSLNNFYSQKLKKTTRHPVILIIEPSLELFPWEMTATLKDQRVTRILSLHLLYALYNYHKPQIVNGFRELPVSSAYCLLNPDKSLTTCQEQMSNFLKKDFSWIQVEAGEIPNPDKLLNTLSDYNLFMYCGHGSASQYFKSGSVKKALINGLVMLYGCSSNLPRGRGGRTPYQNDTYTYLTNGCPTLIGSLYDITSSDADRASMETLTQMLPQISKNERGKYFVKDPKEPDVLQAVINGKSACQKFWSKCCFIARGIPVKIITTEAEKTELLKSIQ